MSQGGDEAAAAPPHQGGAAVQVKSAPVLSSNGDVSMPFQASNPLSIPHSGSGTTDSASSGRMDAHGGTRTSHVHSSDNVQPEQEELPTGQAHARPRLPAAQRPEAAFAAVSDNRVEDSQSKDETTYGTLRTGVLLPLPAPVSGPGEQRAPLCMHSPSTKFSAQPRALLSLHVSVLFRSQHGCAHGYLT